MADFCVKYHYQLSSSWYSTSMNVTFPWDSPSASDLKKLVMTKARNINDIRLIEVEKRGTAKVTFSVKYHYKLNQNESGNGLHSSNTNVIWYNDSPSINDIEELVLGHSLGYYSVAIDEITKR